MFDNVFDSVFGGASLTLTLVGRMCAGGSVRPGGRSAVGHGRVRSYPQVMHNLGMSVCPGSRVFRIGG